MRFPGSSTVDGDERRQLRSDTGGQARPDLVSTFLICYVSQRGRRLQLTMQCPVSVRPLPPSESTTTEKMEKRSSNCGVGDGHY